MLVSFESSTAQFNNLFVIGESQTFCRLRTKTKYYKQVTQGQSEQEKGKTKNP